MTDYFGSEDFESGARAEAEILRGKAERAAGEAKASFRRLKDEAMENYETLKSGTFERVAAVDEFVRERPYVAVGLAVLAGMLVTHLLRSHGPKVIYIRDGRAKAV